ncbi:hypothetical protein JW992_05455, partial [candidate division KSB1 bacterium]|nr:hypothetical protein [candidate division KSB1 bacterium]
HPWDGMQIHSPRMVLGETALDMWALSYADPQLARQVITGTFTDAIAANVPCVREDGSVNMVGADGSECGTAPMWGFPFHAIRSIYSAAGDSLWIAGLYPYLKNYIHWWLENRTDDQGWFHCNNSWESGQDGSRRFLVEGEGDPATFVRTVDVEASMAQAMQNMAFFAVLAGRPDEVDYWNKLAVERIRRTRSMFVDGWFRDWDGRNDQPILFEDFYDPIMLAPLTCAVASREQIEQARAKISYIAENLRWLQWPPGLLAFAEAAWTAGETQAAARAVCKITDRIYKRTDSRALLFTNTDDPFSYRIPGIANEFWPVDNRPAGSENYGWGAILPLFIMRTVMGFRENDDRSFFLAPSLPEDRMQIGKTYGVENLAYQGMRFDLSYAVQDNRTLNVSLVPRTRETVSLVVLDSAGKTIARIDSDQPVQFKAVNGERYRVAFHAADAPLR